MLQKSLMASANSDSVAATCDSLRRRAMMGRLNHEQGQLFYSFCLEEPCGAQFEFTLAAIAQNLRRLAKLVARPPPPAAPCVV
jgi:hypothetical protein